MAFQRQPEDICDTDAVSETDSESASAAASIVSYSRSCHIKLTVMRASQRSRPVSLWKMRPTPSLGRGGAQIGRSDYTQPPSCRGACEPVRTRKPLAGSSYVRQPNP